jgi:hypothetical protein
MYARGVWALACACLQAGGGAKIWKLCVHTKWMIPYCVGDIIMPERSYSSSRHSPSAMYPWVKSIAWRSDEIPQVELDVSREEFWVIYFWINLIIKWQKSLPIHRTVPTKGFYVPIFLNHFIKFPISDKKDKFPDYLLYKLLRKYINNPTINTMNCCKKLIQILIVFSGQHKQNLHSIQR